MKEDLDINHFNIIQDEENYYFFRALNMADNSDVEQGITLSQNGEIERIRTDRERFEGETKYTEDSELSLEEIYDHIKMHYRKDTNCISLTSNSNIAIQYGRGSYKDSYIMVKIPKTEFGKQTVVAGQYMLQELSSRIEQALESLNLEERQRIDELFTEIENSQNSKTLQGIITKRYTAPIGEVDIRKAHPRKGITYNSPKARISSYQSLNDEQLLVVNKVYAKLAILENAHILEHVVPHSSNSKLRETIGNAFSSTEIIHYGDIRQEAILEIPKEVVDIFALIQQVEGLEKERIEELKVALIIAVQSGVKIPPIADIDWQVKDDISIEDMYALTNGTVEYGKASSVVKNLFYLSKSRRNAIELSNTLRGIFENDARFEEIIRYIRENGFRVEPEIISRQSGNGVKLSESVNLNLQKEERTLVEDIKRLSIDELEAVLQNGGLLDIQDMITKTYGNESRPIDKSRYYAEAIISQYDWQAIGIEEFKIEERNELIKRLQDRNCIEIYHSLKQAGIAEKQIPTFLLNIATRQGLYERYANGNLTQLLSESQEVLQGNINIEVVEKFLGYYDVEDTEIKLKDYQQRAFNNTNKILQDHKFAQVILPTGAGKSFVALAQMQQYVKEHPNEKMLYLAPQAEILSQMKDYIARHIHGKKDTVGKSIDEIVAEVFPNITFEVYSGLLAKRGQEIIKEKYGMIVLDELHRTGAKEWEGKIDTLFGNQDENVKVLGITATPVRDVDGRDMAEENAKKLGYTEDEIRQRKHLAANMTLENAIRMGYVVNPKLVYCKYDLISSGKMDELRAKIDSIEDESTRNEELQKYTQLRTRLNQEIEEEIGEDARKKLEEEARKNLESGIGKEEILKQNIKRGGRYIVFIPVSDQGDIEDEDGNRIGRKTGEDKIKAYQEYLNKVFEGTDIIPQCHAMSGSWNGREKNKSGEDKNQQELSAFSLDNSDETKFMIVMNKANEGLHIDGIDGIIWFRALDENSRILYLQQLGRTIYALDEDNPLPEDKRPIVIDLTNNSLTVKMEKSFEKAEPIDDLEALTIVIEWVNAHNGMLPDRNSSHKQEQHYYAVLRKIQKKYSKYLEGFENFEELSEEAREEIQQILALATEIDLWDIDLPPIPKTRGNKGEINPFEITEILKDYVELQDEIENMEQRTTYEQVIAFLESHDGRLMQGGFSENGKVLTVAEMTKEQQYEKNLYQRWFNSDERQILEKYIGQPIENVPEEYREKIARLRSLIKVKKTTYEQVIDFLETHDGKLMQKGKLKIAEMTQEQKYESNLYQKWLYSDERQILEEYTGQPIEAVPEEYQEKIAKLREFGLRGTTYEKVIAFLETHDGKLMRSRIKKNGKILTVEEITKEEQEEVSLYRSWNRSDERQILEEYTGQPIEAVPEEYQEKIVKLREFGLGVTAYEKVIAFLETHDGELMQGNFQENGKVLNRKEMTKEQKKEVELYDVWRISDERQILEKYTGQPIEAVPEEYRKKIAKLREFGLGVTTYEKVIAFLETHDGKLMRNRIKENGKPLKVAEMTQEQQSEINLYANWKRSTERKILDEYAGEPIEAVPEEYRKKIARLREFGLGTKKSKLSQAKQRKDEAEAKNEQAKELEQRVAEELKKRGQVHEQQ